MQSKFGFGDGDTVPAGVEHYRKAYILTLNAALQREGSTVRVAAYNRFGAHNWCLITLISADEYNALTAEQILSGDYEPTSSPNPDDAYITAFERAREADVDDTIEATTTVDQAALDEIIQKLRSPNAAGASSS